MIGQNNIARAINLKSRMKNKCNVTQTNWAAN